MTRIPIKPGDVVICTMIGDCADGPFPHYFTAIVQAIHDDHLLVWDNDAKDICRVKRERVITQDQMKELKSRYLRGEDDNEC